MGQFYGNLNSTRATMCMYVLLKYLWSPGPAHKETYEGCRETAVGFRLPRMCFLIVADDAKACCGLHSTGDLLGPRIRIV